MPKIDRKKFRAEQRARFNRIERMLNDRIATLNGASDGSPEFIELQVARAYLDELQEHRSNWEKATETVDARKKQGARTVKSAKTASEKLYKAN